MFLILGTAECKYCLESKKLLDSKCLKYHYIDLGEVLGNWRSIFTILKSILGPQKTIPIVFQNKTQAKESGQVLKEQELTVDNLTSAGWTLVGTFFDLEELVEELGHGDGEKINGISDDY